MHKGGRARAPSRVTLSEEKAVGEGVAEINQVERMGLGTGGVRMGALACISLGRDEWGACAEGRWFDGGDQEVNDILIIVVVVVKN